MESLATSLLPSARHHIQPNLSSLNKEASSFEDTPREPGYGRELGRMEGCEGRDASCDLHERLRGIER